MKEDLIRRCKDQATGKISNTLILFLTLLLIGFFIFCFYPIKVLKATNFQREEYLKSWRIKNGEIFAIEYIHSVEQSPVLENFLVEHKDIVLLDTYFHSYGAGLPATTPYKTEITDKGIHVYDINLKIEDLIYRTSSLGREHKLIFRNKDFMFLDFSNHRTGVRFQIDHMANLAYLIKECRYFGR